MKFIRTFILLTSFAGTFTIISQVYYEGKLKVESHCIMILSYAYNVNGNNGIMRRSSSVVQARLSHSRISIALDTYSYVASVLQEAVAR